MALRLVAAHHKNTAIIFSNAANFSLPLFAAFCHVLPRFAIICHFFPVRLERKKSGLLLTLDPVQCGYEICHYLPLFSIFCHVLPQFTGPF